MSDGRKMGHPPAAHVYSAKRQPATRYVVTLDLPSGATEQHVFTNPRRRLLHCDHCGRRRRAENMTVQVYYDMSLFHCVEPCQPAEEVRRG